MAPKTNPQKYLKKKVVLVSTIKDATSANSVENPGQRFKKITGGRERQVAQKKQVAKPLSPEVKVACKTKQTKISCSQKKVTTDRNFARKNSKNGQSQSGEDSQAGTVLAVMKRSQRQSKSKAISKITQHFEDAGTTQSVDCLAIKQESKIVGTVAGMQKRKSGMRRKRKVGEWKHNGREMENQEKKVCDYVPWVDEIEELTLKTGPKKRKSAKDKDVQRGVRKEEDTIMDTCLQETAKGNKYIGAHTSIAGGLYNAVLQAVAIGAKAFGLFLRNQRRWLSKPMSEKDISDFKMAIKDFRFSPNMVLPHGSYLMNCGSPNDELLQKSRGLLLDELQRCEQLGLVMFNFHPGSTCGEISRDDCIQRIADSVNVAHEKTKYVITVLENMCCQGNTIGGHFTELRSIIDLVHDKTRVGVCIDTCHAFAAGYDLSTEDGYNKMMADIEDIIGLKYLKAVHLNDSKGKVGCHLDRHENIGRGHIGLSGFQRILNDRRFDNIPLLLETPAELDDSKEVCTLYALIKA